MSDYRVTDFFAHIGFNNVVRAGAILAVMRSTSQCARRNMREAKKVGAYVDLTAGHPLRSILLTNDSRVIGCGLSTRTIQRRLNGEEYNDNFEDDEEEIDYVPDEEP